jgi:hypothetical protein
MSVGSEKFAWKQFPGVPHICAVCKRELRVADVRRDHTTYVQGKATSSFFCHEHVHGSYA